MTVALCPPSLSRMITVVLAEDHALARRALRLILDGEPLIDVLAETADLSHTLHRTALLRPDALVLDLTMPDGPGLPAIPALLVSSPSSAVVVVTMQDDAAYAREALRAGALAYVVKEEADDHLAPAIMCACRGETYLSPRVAAKLGAVPAAAPEPPA